MCSRPDFIIDGEDYFCKGPIGSPQVRLKGVVTAVVSFEPTNPPMQEILVSLFGKSGTISREANIDNYSQLSVGLQHFPTAWTT